MASSVTAICQWKCPTVNPVSFLTEDGYFYSVNLVGVTPQQYFVVIMSLNSGYKVRF